MFAAVDLSVRSPGLCNVAAGLFNHVSPVRPAFQMAAAEFSLFVFFVAGALSRLLGLDFMMRELRRSLRA